MNSLARIAKYLSEGFARIFSPTKDEYPPTGVQPYQGESYDKKHHSDW